MPKYELLYIIGSKTSEDKIPEVIEEVKKDITSEGGNIEKHDEWGKRKLSYPINKTKTGFYVLDYFTVDSEKVKEIEDRIRTNQAVIRYLILNYDEAERRMKKDKKEQAKMQPSKEYKESDKSEKPSKPKKKKEKPSKKKADKKIDIDLDAEIEKALESEDLK